MNAKGEPACDCSTWAVTAFFAILTFIVDSGTAILDQQRAPLKSVNEVGRFLVFDPEPGHREWLRILQEADSYVLLGSRNALFNVSLTDLVSTSEISMPVDAGRAITGKYGCHDLMLRIGAGKSQCEDNYVRTLIPLSSEKTLVCGSNAGQASCQTLEYNPVEERWTTSSSNSDWIQRASNYFAPPVPWFNSTSFGAGPGMSVYFGGCIIDYFNSFTCLMYRASMNKSIPTLQTGKTPLSVFRFISYDRGVVDDSRIYPNFISHFETEQYVYWLYTEVSYELIPFLYKSVSRIARACKNDVSNEHLLQDDRSQLFATLFKATLECSVPGKFVHTDLNTIDSAGYHTFYFDEIAGASKLGMGSLYVNGSTQQLMFYGVFNTHRNSIRGSAVCAFALNTIDTAFGGSLYLFNNIANEPNPTGWSGEIFDFKQGSAQHPATCDDTLARSESWRYGDNRLLVSSATPITDTPLFFQTDHSYTMTQIAVDWQVLAQNGKHYDVLHVGTDDGRILKLINFGIDGSAKFTIIEDRTFSAEGEAVAELRLITYTDPSRSRILLVNTFEKIVKLSVEACNQWKTCYSCVSLRDPYCSWDTQLLQCVSSYRSGVSSTYVQDIDDGVDERCPAPDTDSSSSTEPNTPGTL